VAGARCQVGMEEATGTVAMVATVAALADPAATVANRVAQVSLVAASVVVDSVGLEA